MFLEYQCEQRRDKQNIMINTVNTLSATRPFMKLLILLAGVVFSAQAAAANPDVVHLHDGSVITGEIVGFKDGVYSIETENIGTITIEKSKIKSIQNQFSGDEPEPSKKTAPGVRVDPGRIQNMQEALMADQEIMEMIQALESDPNVQALINDPEIKKAINSGDIGTLLSNPDFMDLLNNPKIKEINKKIVE